MDSQEKKPRSKNAENVARFRARQLALPQPDFPRVFWGGGGGKENDLDLLLLTFVQFYQSRCTSDLPLRSLDLKLLISYLVNGTKSGNSDFVATCEWYI